MFKVKFFQNALEDYVDIGKFIAKDNLFYANEVLNKLESSINLLETFPLIGKSRKDGLREIIEPQYKFRIIYLIKGEIIYVVSIFKYKNSWE